MTNKLKLLFINPLSKECGIYQYGKNIFNSISSGNLPDLIAYYSEVTDFNMLSTVLNDIKPQVVVFNHVRTKNSWIYSCENTSNIKFIDLLHEAPEYTNYKENKVFKHHIIANPNIDSLNLGKSFFPLPRLIPKLNDEEYQDTGVITVGGFSFGTLDRGWLSMLDVVSRDIPNALVKFHMPFNSVVDPGGRYHALPTSELCRNKAKHLNLNLEIDHTFLPVEDLIRKLGQNTINLFLYKDMSHKTISSATDFALAARRPFGINSSPMYSHFKDIEPLINVDKNTLNSIIDRGTSLLTPYYDKWNSHSFSKSFETTILTIIQN